MLGPSGGGLKEEAGLSGKIARFFYRLNGSSDQEGRPGSNSHNFAYFGILLVSYVED